MEELLSKQYFEEVSEDWDQMGNSFFGNAPRDRIYKEVNFSEGMTVADIGSGSGYLLEGLAGKGVKRIAIDQSPEMLERIKAKFMSDPNLSAIEGQSESLPLADGQADVVMANMYLHHVERPPKAIHEMARILKPGGTMIFTDLDSHDHDELIEEQFDRWKGFEREDIRQWMTQAGLSDIEIDCVGADCCTSTGCGDKIAINIFVAKGIKSSNEQ